MIDSTKVLICTPSLDGKVEIPYAGGLASSAAAHLFGNMVFLGGVSHVALARNALADGFLRSEFEWMVFIDADIGFSAHDLKLLLDYEDKPAMNEAVSWTTYDAVKAAADAPLFGETLIVTAEYSRKDDTLTPARFGLGFTRIHRSVFEALQKLTFEDGSPRVVQFTHQGRLVHDYFISGAMTSGDWIGEDTGFFSLVRLAGILPRVEQRTQLVHIGRKVYPYVAPAMQSGAA